MASVVEQVKANVAKDPVLFLSKLVPITHPIKGVVPFHLYPFQADALRHISTNRFVLINKARQMGISTLLAGYILWKMLHNDSYTVLVLATNTAVAANLITKVRFMNSNLPSWIRKRELNDNAMSLTLENGSKVKAVSSKPSAARSEALSLLVLDEAAFIDKADEVWTAAGPTLSTGGDCVILSTPNGYGNFFAQEWLRAKSGESQFFPIEMPWWLHPDRDQKWFDEKLIELGKQQAYQEYCCDFISSGNTLVPGEVLKWYQDNMVKDPIRKEGPGQGLWIWEDPQPNQIYITTCDVSRGDGSDYSTFHVLKYPELEQVAEFKGKIPPEQLGSYAASISMQYNNALLSIENASIGYAAIVSASKSYKYMYFSPRNYKKENFYVDEEKDVMGFTTSAFSRPLMMNGIDKFIGNKQVIIRSSRLIDELFVFVWLNGKPQAQSTFNDDLVMAWSQAPFILEHSADRIMNYQRDVADDIRVGFQQTYIQVQRSDEGNPWIQTLPNGMQVDLRELL